MKKKSYKLLFLCNAMIISFLMGVDKNKPKTIHMEDDIKRFYKHKTDQVNKTMTQNWVFGFLSAGTLLMTLRSIIKK
jgi:hypothetical protein